MAYFLFFIYLLLFSWLITRSKTFKTSGLPAKWLVALFLAKVAGGVLYGFIYSGYKEDADTWVIYKWGLTHYELLLHNPGKFLQFWLADGSGKSVMNEANNMSDIFGSDGSFWNNLKDMVLIKAEAIMNIFSFGHYYVNVVLYAFLTFGGYMAFYRGLLLIYPGSRITSLIAAFLIPSCFFWTSGMYKDGLIFILFGYLVYAMAGIMMNAGRQAKYFVKISIVVAVIFILRSYIVLLLLPCLFAWWLSVKYPSKTAICYSGIFGLCLLSFFITPYLLPSINFPQFLVTRRNEFLLLPANSSLPAGELQASFTSYLKLLPEALNHGFLRPYLWENKGLFYIPFALELIVFYLLLLIYWIKQNKAVTTQQYSFLLFGLFFITSSWLLLGYTVPIIGALVRYKSIFISFSAAHILYYVFPRLNTLDK